MIENLISNISDKSIQNFIRSRNSSFKEYKEDLSYILQDKTLFQNLYKLGEISYGNSDELLVFYCAYKGELSSKSSKRTQFEIAKKVLKEDFKDGAIFVFYDDKGKFRFSFIRKNYGDKTEKLSNWKRFTYFVDKQQQTNRTFIDTIGSCNFDSLEHIQDKFNLEPISKEFFKGYKDHYEKFCNYMLTNKVMLKNFEAFLTDGSNKAIRDYVKKLLGRIVFLQFLQKKGWMGVPKNSKDWLGGDTNFLESLFNSCSREQQENFLDKVLEPMFFNSLNSPRENDWYDTQTSIGIVKIPYLNGGLFEKDNLDEPDSKFPSKFFKELFEFFNRYNFTIDENDPNDAEVGVDPEMLGHIFENLLEDNKDKGAFYTPKEIVHYMCQESLIEYLNTSLKTNSDIEKEQVTNLIKYHDLGHCLVTRISEMDRLLDEVKICDPAIGSGAFPMGLLHEIFQAKQTLWLYKNHNLNLFPASKIKINIIQNSIYGVDIEKGAVDIARLRFWLSLVVDEEKPNSLPNLDFKIIQGNSLIESFEGFDLSDIIKGNKNQKAHGQLTMGFDSDKTANNLNNLINHYFKIKSSAEKHRVMQEINNQVKEHIKNCANHTPDILRKVEVIDFNNKPFFLWHLYFADVFENGGFDIVIGNPPYVNIANIKDSEYRDLLKTEFKVFKNKTDLYAFFLERGKDLLKPNGTLTFIVSNSWLGTDSFSLLRKMLIEETKINYIVKCPNNVFNAAVTTIIISFNNTIETVNDIKLLELVNNEFISAGKTNYDIIKRKVSYGFSFNKEVLIKKYDDKLGEIAEFSLGIKTSDDKRFIFDKKINNDCYPLLRGKDINKYTLNYNNKWIWYRPDLMMEKLGAGPRRKEIFKTKEKILIKDVAAEIQATIDISQYFTNDTINVIYSLKKYSYEYIVAILNSKLINKWFKTNFEAGLHIKINQLYHIPLVRIKESTNTKIKILVDRIIKNNSEGKHTKKNEEEINHIIYKIYDLNYNEISIIDPEFSLSRAEYESISLD